MYCNVSQATVARYVKTLSNDTTNPKNEKGHAKHSMREQAEKYIAARANRGQSKSTGAILRSDRTVACYQGDLGRAAEYIQAQFNIKKAS